MVVAFLDLLGFSNHLEIDEEVAFDNLNLFNDLIRTRVLDDKTYPLSYYKDSYPGNTSFHRFVEKSSVSSFEYLISVSDSLVIGSRNVDLFIEQLMNFVAAVYINYSESFKKPFVDIRDVESSKVASGLIDGKLRYHKALPLLFRGGVSLGDQVNFFQEFHIYDSKLAQTSLNVSGLTYLKSVKLERAGSGPRLFCDSTIVNAISNKKIIKKVDIDLDIYEIVWTIEGCETGDNSIEKWHNVTNSIYDKMLPAAVNLYKYYRLEEKLEPQYRELVNLICYGIIKYANDECNRAEDAINNINKYITRNGCEIKIEKSLLDDFLA